MKIQQDQKVIISPEVLFQEVSGEIVLLDLASESYFGLDEIGARIWALLNEEKTVGQIVGVLLDWADGGDTRFRGNVFGLKVGNRKSGLDITPETGECCWKGERMDDDTAVLCMLQLE